MPNSDFLKGECRHCAGHIEFPTEAKGQTVPCPHCGQPTELAVPVPPQAPRGHRRVFAGVGIAVLVAAAGLAGAFFWWQKANGRSVSEVPQPPAILTNKPTVSTTAPVVARKPQLQELTNDFAILPFQLEKTPGSSLIYVTGTIQNLSGRQRFGVKVEFGLFDTNDNPSGSATDYQSVLDPHADWHFKAMVMASKTTSVRFHSIVEEK